MMGRRSVFVLGLTAAACGGSRGPAALGNTIDGLGNAGGPAIRVAPDGRLGTLALATARDRGDLPYWVPITDIAPVVAPPESGLVAGTAYAVVAPPGPGGGAPVTLTAGAGTTVPYGCDGNSTEMTPLTGAAVPPGLVWVLPADAPATWRPAAVTLRADETSRTLRHWTAGPLQLALSRVDDSHAAFSIHVAGVLAHSEQGETYYMEGADPAPLDLTHGKVPGIPVPEAVFAFGPDGPYLVVVDRSGFEGVAFDTLLVDGEQVHFVKTLAIGLYFCAF